MNVTIYSDILPSAGFGINSAIKAAAAGALKDDCSNTKRILLNIDNANRS